MIPKHLLAILFLPFALHANIDSLALPLEQQAPQEIQSLWKQGLQAQDENDFNQAIELIDSSLCLLQNEYTWNHPLIATAMNHLGNVYFENTYINQAYFYHSQALEIRKEYFGLQHPETAKSYNNLANCHLAIGDYETAVHLYQQTAAIRKNSPDIPRQELASVYNNLGNCYLSLGALLKARKYYEQSLAIRETVFGERALKTAQSKLGLGNVYAALQQPDSALTYFEATRLVFENHYEKTDAKLASLYENMGNALVAQQRFVIAEKYLKKALTIRQVLYNEKHPSYIQSYQNIGDLWLQRGDYQQAYHYFSKALALLLERWGEYHPQVAQAYEQLGLALLYQGKTKEAKSYFLQSVALRQSLFGANHPYVAGSWLNLGNVLWQEGNYEEARVYFKKSLSIWKEYGDQWHLDQLKAHLNISETYLEESHPLLAQNALTQVELLLNNSLSSIYTANYLRIAGKIQQSLANYEAADRIYEQVFHLLQQNNVWNNEKEATVSLEKLLYLQSRAENQLLFAKASNDVDKAQKALAFFEQAMDGLAVLQTTYSNPEARQQMTALYQPLFEGAVATCFFLAEKTKKHAFYHQKALIFSERNKSIRLLEVNSIHQKPNSAITDNSNQDRGVVLQYLNRLFLDESKLAKLQTNLGDKEAIISFFQGQHNIYVFILDQNKVYAHQLDVHYPWQTMVFELGKNIIQFPAANSKDKLKLDSLYRFKAYQLYEKLFAPLLSEVKGKDHLLIIPDGIFNYLPFETLLSSLPEKPLKYRSYPFLIQDYTISYTYSISQWVNGQNKPIIAAPPKYSCLTIVPDFKDAGGRFSPLEHNLSEAKQVLNYYQGELLQGAMANREQFLSKAPAYAILHFATHGQTDIYDGDYAYLVLAPDSIGSNDYSKLFVKDLYNQQWKAQLAVLSACETGIGSFRLGEGVISLGRGFAQAGVRSSVSTLWKINDAKTAELMSLFYQNLKQGARKDDALQKAKMDQLTAGSHELAHPFYWAAYLPYGDMQPLQISTSFFNWWLIGGLLLLGGGLLVCLKNNDYQ